ncbi:uncharacterized protein LOC129984345 isoform X4 [Argiope bruennichi]|uniref:uncharacterized protein LOC129984345 isoform X4 n=1 Tax=Argiope bruennichi TaxID=94029 RepID=UPI00249572EB|nr:uncharacterized protein LOC129984345 isoform X4 [Argiope bruennichi]
MHDRSLAIRFCFKWPVKMASVQRDQWCYVVLQCLLLNLLLCRNGAFADKNKYYHISTLCTKERNLQMYKKIDGTVLTSEGEDNLSCVLTFQTDTILQRFMLRFERLALDCNDHLYIFDGAHAFGNYKADLSCRSTRADVGTIFTQSNFVTLKYVTDKWTQPGNGFKLVITTFKDSPVGCRDFLCMNSFCITPDLTCDGVNHCGDNSDETSHASCIDDTSGNEILGMAAGAFATCITVLIGCGLLFCGVGVCLCRRARLQRDEPPNASPHSLVAGHQPYPMPRYSTSPDRHEEKPPPYPGGGFSPGTGITYNMHDESLYYPTK